MTVAVIVEVGPNALATAGLDAPDPQREFGGGVVAAIPFCYAMEPDINFVRGFYKFIGQPRAAARTEDRARFFESSIHLVVPPTAMTALNHVAPVGVELSQDRFQAHRAIMITLLGVTHKPPRSLSGKVGNESAILHQGPRRPEALNVSDQYATFLRINYAARPGLLQPCLDGIRSRPGIKGRIELHC